MNLCLKVYNMNKVLSLKGESHQIFLLLAFFMNQFSPSLRGSENSRRYSHVKVTTGINDVNDTGGKNVSIS